MKSSTIYIKNEPTVDNHINCRFLFGRGRRTRTLKNGFGDRHVTITSYPLATYNIIHHLRVIVKQIFQQISPKLRITNTNRKIVTMLTAELAATISPANAPFAPIASAIGAPATALGAPDIASTATRAKSR